MKDNERDYYIVSFSTDKTIKYTIWFTDDIDGFVTDNKKNIMVFESVNQLCSYAEEHEIIIDQNIDIKVADCDVQTNYDIYDYNVDYFERYDYSNIVCNEILNFWNIVTDITVTMETKLLGTDEDNNIFYEKLFYGCNIPAMNMPENYIPKWSDKERDKIKQIVDEGIAIVKKYIFG